VQAPQQISAAIDNSLQTEKRTTYLPLTKGCSWNYNVISNGKTKLSTVTMLKGTVLINGKSYRPAKLKQGKKLRHYLLCKKCKRLLHVH